MVYKIIMGLAQEEQRVINVWIPAPTVYMLGSSQDRHLASDYSGWSAGYSQGQLSATQPQVPSHKNISISLDNQNQN